MKKIIIVGPPGVGKKYFADSLSCSSKLSDTGTHYLVIWDDYNWEDIKIMLKIFDDLSQALCHDAFCYLLVFDITDRESYEWVTKLYYPRMKQYLWDYRLNSFIYLIGNKVDMSSLWREIDNIEL